MREVLGVPSKGLCLTVVGPLLGLAACAGAGPASIAASLTLCMSILPSAGSPSWLLL